MNAGILCPSDQFRMVIITKYHMDFVAALGGFCCKTVKAAILDILNVY